MLVAVAGLWIAYLVPHRLRFRQQLLESRAEDRFSENLRVLRVAHAVGTTAGRGSGTRGQDGSARVQIHPARRGGDGHMERPHATRDRVVADAVRATAAAHAQRAAHLARRRAAARRRAVLTAGLLLVTAVAWVLVATGTAVWAGAVPTAVLGGALLLGRRAVVAGARADAEWAAGAADRVPLPGVHAVRVTGRAVRPSDAQTEVIARVRTETRVERATVEAAPVPADAGSAGAAAPSTGLGWSADVEVAAEVQPAAPAEESSWVPVPVPRPSYTLKPSAPRREPAPLTEADIAASTASAPASTSRPAEAAEEVPTAGRNGVPVTGEGAAGTAARLDLDAILERRRASGE